MRHSTKICLVLAFVLSMGSSGSLGAQDKFPSKPVEIIVSWAAGGATDVLFRAVGIPFPKYANQQQFIVKNIPGGGAAIGYTEALKAKGDGYTFVAVATPMITKIHMSNVKFSATSFAPAILIADNACFLLVHKDSPYKTLKDYIEDAKKRPGQINMGNAGSGGGYHLASLAFQNFTKIKLNHIPFEGGGPSITALMGKHVDSIIVSAPEGVPQALAGQLEAPGVFGDTRLDKFPLVATAKEQGHRFQRFHVAGDFGSEGHPARFGRPYPRHREKMHGGSGFQEEMRRAQRGAEIHESGGFWKIRPLRRRPLPAVDPVGKAGGSL